MPSTGTLVFNDQKLQAPEMYATESLGVGVSVPTSNLEVTGNAYVSSNLEIGTANLFVDTTTGNVGISTATPESKLHITNTTDSTGTGDAFISGLVSNGSNRKPTECLRLQGQWRSPGSGALLRFTNYHGGGTNPNTGEYNTAGIAGFDYANQWGGGLCLYTAPNTTNGGDLTPRMTIDSSGFVGIGTTGPAQLLHIHNDDEYVYTRLTTTAASTTDIFDIACWNSTRSNGDHGIMFINRANTDMRFLTNDTERLRIKNGGNVGIGTTTPYAKLHVASHGPTYTGISGNDRFRIEELVTNGHRYGLQMGIDWSTGNSSIQNYFQYSNGTYTHSYNLLLNPHGGNVGIGTTNPQGTLHIDTASNGEIMIGAITSSHATAPVCIRDIGGNQIHFYYAHTQVGKITSSSSSTSYQTTSDYRLKENVIPLVSALERVNDLPVYRFNFITDTEKTVDGFFAHEVQNVVPEAIDGVKDGTEDIGVITNIEDGKTIKSDVTEPTELKEGTEWTYTGSRPVYQSIDHSKLVPLLTRCIQELSAKNDALEARIAALENA